MNVISSEILIIYQKPLYLLRCLLTLVILVALSNYPSIQMLTLILISLFQQIFIIRYAPFDSNSLKLFNEFGVSCYLYLTLLLSYCSESSLDIESMRLVIGWTITGILGFVTAVNLSVFVAKSFKYLLKRVKLRKERKQMDGKVV